MKSHGFYDEYETDRLIIRKLTPETYHYIFENLTEKEQIQFLGLSSNADLQKEKNKYEKGLATYNKTFVYFFLLDKDDHNIIGWCGFHLWNIDHDRAEIGYGIFREDLKQKGLMTEATQFVIDYGFSNMKLQRIEACVSPKNEASLRLLQNFNFQKEGLLRNHYLIDGIYEDSLIFSLLKEEVK